MKRLLIGLWLLGCVNAHAFTMLPQFHTPQAASQSRTFTAAAQVNSTGVSWTNIGNAFVVDGAYATTTGSGSIVSNYLDLTGASFAVPQHATITGIEVFVTRHYSGSETSIGATIQLMNVGSAVCTAESDNTAWLTSDDTINTGGSSDLWGCTWTPADVNNSSFGVQYWVNGTGWSSTTAYIDAITVTVFYTD